MLSKRKKRSLDREIPHLRDTNIIFVAIEGGNANTSREAKYFDIFREDDIRFQFKVIPCDDHRASPDQVLENLKTELINENLQDGDEKWMVVDVDKYERHLPKVAKECQDVNINLAVSNPCFEFWLLLHYQNPPHEQLNSCTDVKGLYSAHADNDERNNGGFAAMFKTRAKDAVERAEVLDDGNRWPQQNGSRVYKIIKRFI